MPWLARHWNVIPTWDYLSRHCDGPMRPMDPISVSEFIIQKRGILFLSCQPMPVAVHVAHSLCIPAVFFTLSQKKTMKNCLESYRPRSRATWRMTSTKLATKEWTFLASLVIRAKRVKDIYLFKSQLGYLPFIS